MGAPGMPAGGTVVLDAVAFDVMDTVVRDPFREALEAATGRPSAEVLAARERGAYPAFERGELSERDYWAAYRRGGVVVDVPVFHRYRRAGYAWIAGMRALLAGLDGVVVRAAATNYPLWIDELADRVLIGWFDRIVASHHLGVRKPAPGFYRGLLAELGLAAGRVLFVDDRKENVEGARAAGLHAHRFVGVADLRRRLQVEGVDV